MNIKTEPLGCDNAVGIWVNGEPCYVGWIEDDGTIRRYVDSFDLLMVAQEAFHKKEFKTGHDLIKIADAICPKSRWDTYWSLRYAVMIEITWLRCIKEREPNESTIQDFINDNHHKFFGENSRVIKKEFTTESGRADFLIEQNGQKVIVECKRGKVGRSALRQIRRYMNETGIKKGILVGESCDIELPNDVEFVSYTTIYKKYCN